MLLVILYLHSLSKGCSIVLVSWMKGSDKNSRTASRTMR